MWPVRKHIRGIDAEFPLIPTAADANAIRACSSSQGDSLNHVEKPHRLSTLLPWLPTVLIGPVIGLYLARVMYEVWPAQRAVLATWQGTAQVAAAALLILLGLRWIGLRVIRRFTLQPAQSLSIALIPFLILLVYVLWPRVNLLMAGILLVAAGCLSLALVLRALVQDKWQWVLTWAVPISLVIVALTAYLLTMGRTVGAADTFEFQVVAPTLGIAHPTGYPLFILIGKLFSLIPTGLVAWRVNLVSVTFATVTTLLVYISLHRLTGQRSASALAALCLAFSRVFWSQALEAEVYPLNAACVAAILLLLVGQVGNLPNGKAWLFALAAVYGLSFTNHLTMVILAPAIVLGVLLARPRVTRWDWLLAAGAFLAPLLIDLYIPLRWPALHNGQWMSFRDFIAWITGEQFRGAMQFGLWRDPTRWHIVGGLMLEALGPVGAALAAMGLVWLIARRWRIALLTFIAWAGYFAYGLIYNVPDVSVFIIPAHILMAVWIGAAVAWLVRGLAGRTTAVETTPIEPAAGNLSAQMANDTASAQADARLQALEVRPRSPGLAGWMVGLTWVAFALLPLSLAWTNGPQVDQSQVGWELYRWGRHVMDLPMPTGSAILADSEKIAPLYYLKRIENVRPDVDTLVLGDEGLYRAELDQRVAKGQPVYLARYLPGLAGPYRLHSLGPLVRVTTKPATSPPPMQKQLDNVSWGGNQISLLGLDVEPGEGGVAWRITLYWQARVKLSESYHVRLRWRGPSGQVWWQDHGAHPVGGYNPTAAWLPGEVVADYHEIPADATIPPGLLRLDVGLFLPFRDEGLNRDGTASPWFTLVLLEQLSHSAQHAPLAHEMRASFGDELLITGVSDPGVLPPGEPVSVELEWMRARPGPDRTFRLRWTDARGVEVETDAGRYPYSAPPYAGEYPTSKWTVGEILRARVTLPTPSAPGVYTLRAGWLDADGRELAARCQWLAPITRDCALGTLRVEGTARGQGLNFDNQALLLDAQIGRPEMRPNETLDVKLKWQGLRQWNADYTAFVHLIGPDGKLHGQVDQWPLDGTLATRDWSPGRVVDDPYHVPLAGDAPPGTYQIEVGWYLLATLRRLPVVDAEGRPVDDRVIVGTVTVK